MMKLPKAHKLAMDAKNSIFKAQDATLDITDRRLREMLQKRLAKIREDLEDLDNKVRSAQHGRSEVDCMLEEVRRLEPTATRGLYSIYVRSDKGRLTISWDEGVWSWSWLSTDHVDRIQGDLASTAELPELLDLCKP